MTVTLIISSLYFVLFMFLALKSQQKQWIAGTIVMMMGVFLIIKLRLFGVFAPHTLLLHPYFYISIASFFFFISDWHWQPENRTFYAKKSHSFLSAWAVASFMQHLAYLIVLLIVSWKYPQGYTPYFLPALLKLYLLHPIFWIVIHLFLTTFLWLIGQPQGKQRHFSVVDIQATFLAGLLVMMFSIINDIRLFLLQWT
ncbi:MAG: hypothetical protein IKI11_05030 [Neisseriaceae bacterium]|nr:hypothetical protein [Neisseriaceae bacterium]